MEPPGPGDAVSLAYLALPKDAGPVREVVADWTPEELGEADDAAREVVRWLRKVETITFERRRVGGWLGDSLASLLGQGVLREGGEGA